MVFILGKRFPTRVDFFWQGRGSFLRMGRKGKFQSQEGKNSLPWFPCQGRVSLQGKCFYSREWVTRQGMVYLSGKGFMLIKGKFLGKGKKGKCKLLCQKKFPSQEWEGLPALNDNLQQHTRITK